MWLASPLSLVLIALEKMDSYMEVLEGVNEGYVFSDSYGGVYWTWESKNQLRVEWTSIKTPPPVQEPKPPPKCNPPPINVIFTWMEWGGETTPPRMSGNDVIGADQYRGYPPLDNLISYKGLYIQTPNITHLYKYTIYIYIYR